MLVVIPTTLSTVINRYYGKEQPTWKMWLDLRGARDPSFHIVLNAPGDFYQAFVCPMNGLTGISVAIVDPGLPPGKESTDYTFALKDAASGEVVREVGIQAFTLDKRLHVDILFDPIFQSKGRTYRFTIFPANTAVRLPISIQLSEPFYHPEEDLEIHGRKSDRSVLFDLIFRSTLTHHK